MSLLKRLGMRYPIFQAPMAGVATPALAAAVSNAGGLGGLGIGSGSIDAARNMIAETQRLTTRPFNVNVFVHQIPRPDQSTGSRWLDFLEPMYQELGLEKPANITKPVPGYLEDAAHLELLLQLRPPVVSFHFGLPPASHIRRLRELGIILMATATSRHELEAIELAGLDAVVAQGSEAGGHRGVFDPHADDDMLTTLELVRSFADRTQLPIIAAGGIMDGRDMKAALDAGATAAQLGTAFISCPESSADDGYREALLSTRPDDTTFTTLISGRPARGTKNLFTELQAQLGDTIVPDFPIGYGPAKALAAAAKTQGKEGYAVRWMGTQAARSRSLPAGQLIAKLNHEMVEAG